MLKSVIWRATLVAMLATLVVMPGVGLAQELRPRQASTEQDGPPRERPGRPDRPADDRDVSRAEVRRCIEAVKEHGGGRHEMRPCLAHPKRNDVTRPELRRCIEAVKERGGSREDLRRCLAEAHGDEITRVELRRCIAAVKEHGGDRDDLRRCLRMAHDKDRPGPAGPAPIFDRMPPAPAAPSSLLERVSELVSL